MSLKHLEHSLAGQWPFHKVRLQETRLVLTAFLVHTGHQQLRRFPGQGLRRVLAGIQSLLGAVRSQSLKTPAPIALHEDVQLRDHETIEQIPSQQGHWDQHPAGEIATNQRHLGPADQMGGLAEPGHMWAGILSRQHGTLEDRW